MRSNRAMRFFLCIAVFIILNSCTPKLSLETIPLPLNKVGRTEEKTNMHLSAPATVAVMVDVSGSMSHYVAAGSEKEDPIPYILRNLHNLWVPVEVVREGVTKRLAVEHVFQVGADVREIAVTSLTQALSTKVPKSFTAYTSLNKATAKIVELLNPAAATVSGVILLSDLHTEISPNEKSCPQGSPPYCVIENLRDLYAGKGDGPGWWILGFKAPYKDGKNMILKPLFISLWSYDIEPSREMMRKIKTELDKIYTEPEGKPDSHLLEIAPANDWMPVKSGKWIATGSIKYKRNEVFSWFPKEQSFKKVGFKYGVFDFEIARRHDSRLSDIEVPYAQKIDLKGKTGDAQFSNRDDTDATARFSLTVPGRSIKGNRKHPDEISIALIASKTMDDKALGWVSEWSVPETPGKASSYRTVNFSELVEAALQVSSPAVTNLESEPIMLKFWQ